MSIHAVGVAGLLLVFVIGTLRPVNLGALALVMTYLVGTIAVRRMVGLMVVHGPRGTGRTTEAPSPHVTRR